MIAIKQRKEARLSTSSALHATESKVISRALDVTEIPQQFLHIGRVAVIGPYTAAYTEQNVPGARGWRACRPSSAAQAESG